MLFVMMLDVVDPIKNCSVVLEINKLDKITLSDADNGVYYMFFYTLLTEETAEDSDNIGALDTVYVYEVPSVID